MSFIKAPVQSDDGGFKAFQNIFLNITKKKKKKNIFVEEII